MSKEYEGYFSQPSFASCMSTMYRAYQPILPTANLYLQDKWDRDRYETHRKKVAVAVPAIVTKGPETPTHLLVNMKKIQMKRELQALVEKQNQIHSKKLSAIRQSQGRLDNWNFYPQLSLNAAKQRQNLNKISYENGKILERILRRESEYGRWESEWEKVKQIQANISRYPQITWLGQHRVTFQDYKRNTDIQHLFEGSETDSTYSRSTLDNNPNRADRDRNKEPLNHKDKRKKQSPIQAERLVGDKPDCNSLQGSPSRFRKRETVATSGKTEFKDKEKSTFNQKSLSKSKNCTDCFSEKTSGGREQENIVEHKNSSQDEFMSDKSQPDDGHRTKCKKSIKAPMSYEDLDEIFDSSDEESDASSCYSLQGSKGRSYSSKSSANSSTSSYSLRSLETPEGSSHKPRISSIQSVYKGHDPSSQESRTSQTSVRHTQASVTSFHKLEVSKRHTSVYSSQDVSFLESENSNYDISQPINSSAERENSSSPESLVIYPQKWSK